MEYTVRDLSKLSGVSSRTLRYYDEINLLKPCRISSSGYRIYGEKEVDLLQQILFYKELELPLEKIKSIVTRSDFDCKSALYDHKENILRRQEELKILLNNLEKTISSLEGGCKMSNEEKFEGLKKKMIQTNEEKYGKEIREKYGEDTINESYKKFSKLTKEQWDEVEALSKKINETLREAVEIGDPTSEKAMEAVKLHKQWLSNFHNYPKEAHIGLGHMYAEDERFTKYYEDNVCKGAAVFLRDAIIAYYEE